jgi:putative Mn2+ efflux pump MntP
MDTLRTLAAIIGAVVTMLVGLWFVFSRLKEKQLGFDTNSIRALGLVMFLPTLILAFSIKEGISSEALAALLGTVAGYVLSRGSSEEAEKIDDAGRPKV